MSMKDIKAKLDS
jgi:hypothetical protein